MSKHALKGIYIHIPFCKHKCSYCSFYSEVDTDEGIKSKYITRLIEEIQKSKIELKTKNERLDTIETLYIGGGTPSLISLEDLKRILSTLEETLNIEIRSLREVTIEVNPGTVNLDYLKALRKIGFNRLSLGIQSLNDKTLNMIQRIHNSQQALLALEYAQKAGFENITVDIMFGIPGQTIEEIRLTLEALMNFPSVKHISAYSLIIEEETPIYTEIEEGKLILPDEDIEREMQYFINSYLKNHGFRHYEISNYAKPGYESIHNSLYWTLDDYIGYGAGASSFYNNERIDNYSTLKDYLNNKQKLDKSLQGIEILKSDFIILGLRMLDGISDSNYQELFKSSIFSDYKTSLDKLVSRGLLNIRGERISLTPKGLDLANQVFIEFI